MLHTTQDGLISAPIPDEPGWTTEESCGVVMGPTVATMLKCKRVASGEFLFFLAKDYGVPREQILDADSLIKNVFSKTYEKMFSQVRYDHVGAIQSLGVTWVEAAMQMLHPRLGVLAKLERVCTVDDRVLLLSVEGAQPDVARHWPAAITTWMSGARFARLAPR